MGFFKRHGSEPPLEVRGPRSRRYAQPQETRSHYGPHFEKGPRQEEIFDRRAVGERFSRDHPELRDRAHSFHHPIQQHEYSVPYKKNPGKWPQQMKTEYEYYHALSDGKELKGYTKAVALAKNTPTGQKTMPTIAHGRAIEAGFVPAVAGRNLANKVVQARQGFVQKYPQAYENLQAIKKHEEQVQQRRTSARDLRKSHRDLVEKHDLWATRMRQLGGPFEGSSKR